jgi:hypothetical protein
MKTKLLMLALVAVAMDLPTAQTLNAQDYCVDPVDQGVCHTATATTNSVTCQVNCLCPYNATINQACYNTWKVVIHTTDSTTSNWGCTNGTTYLNCNPYNANNCYWSKEQAVCPSTSPGQGCIPTLTWVTDGPSARTVIDTTGCNPT